jgi:hypothetical protein
MKYKDTARNLILKLWLAPAAVGRAVKIMIQSMCTKLFPALCETLVLTLIFAVFKKWVNSYLVTFIKDGVPCSKLNGSSGNNGGGYIVIHRLIK